MTAASSQTVSSSEPSTRIVEVVKTALLVFCSSRCPAAMAGRSSSQNATMYDVIEREYGTCRISIGEWIKAYSPPHEEGNTPRTTLNRNKTGLASSARL